MHLFDKGYYNHQLLDNPLTQCRRLLQMTNSIGDMQYGYSVRDCLNFHRASPNLAIMYQPSSMPESILLKATQGDSFTSATKLPWKSRKIISHAEDGLVAVSHLVFMMPISSSELAIAGHRRTTKGWKHAALSTRLVSYGWLKNLSFRTHETQSSCIIFTPFLHLWSSTKPHPRSVNGYQPWLEDILSSCIDDRWSELPALNRELQFAVTVKFPERSNKRSRMVPWSFIVDEMNVPEVYYWTFDKSPPGYEYTSDGE